MMMTSHRRRCSMQLCTFAETLLGCVSVSSAILKADEPQAARHQKWQHAFHLSQKSSMLWLSAA